MSTQDFYDDIAGACPSKQQDSRVTLLNCLMQFPNREGDANLATANHAIDLAQREKL